MNPHLCNICERFAEENPGGTELEVALLFADIRGSTPLAATMNAYDFGQLINRFYQITTNIVYEHGGMVEKLVGDEFNRMSRVQYQVSGSWNAPVYRKLRKERGSGRDEPNQMP